MRLKIWSKYKYKYRYTSPYGEEWIIYRNLFGFIPIKHSSVRYNLMPSQVQEEVDKLNIKQNLKLIAEL